MKTKIKKWGNSLAVRIPSPYAKELSLASDTEVNIEVQDGKLVIEPVPGEHDLETLLAQVDGSNVHEESSYGKPVGKEAW